MHEYEKNCLLAFLRWLENHHNFVLAERDSDGSVEHLNPTNLKCAYHCRNVLQKGARMRDRYLVKFFPLVFVNNNGDGYVIDKRMTTREITK